MVNNISLSLTYFKPDNFAKRMGNAVRMLKESKTADEIQSRNFHSAEGWYSEIVIKSGVSIKIVSRGFDDYSSDPVVYNKGHLIRCPATDIKSCILEELSMPTNISVYDMTPIQVRKFVYVYM